MRSLRFSLCFPPRKQIRTAHAAGMHYLAGISRFYLSDPRTAGLSGNRVGTHGHSAPSYDIGHRVASLANTNSACGWDALFGGDIPLLPFRPEDGRVIRKPG